LISQHIAAASQGTVSLAHCRGAVTLPIRQTLGAAAKWKTNGWFKTVGWMEDAARDIIGPDYSNATQDFKAVVHSLFNWCHGV